MAIRLRRALASAVLLAFSLSTGIQLLLHSHLVEERHHQEGCAAEMPSVDLAHGHPFEGHPGAELSRDLPVDPEHPASHDHCARCVNAPADLRVGPSRLEALQAVPGVRPGRPRSTHTAQHRLGHELRGPPLA